MPLQPCRNTTAGWDPSVSGTEIYPESCNPSCSRLNVTFSIPPAVAQADAISRNDRTWKAPDEKQSHGLGYHKCRAEKIEVRRRSVRTLDTDNVPAGCH